MVIDNDVIVNLRIQTRSVKPWPSWLLISLFSSFLAWVMVLSSAFQVCFWKDEKIFFFSCMVEKKTCCKMISYSRNTVLYNFVLLRRKIYLFHSLETFRTLFKESGLFRMHANSSLFYGKCTLIVCADILVPRDSFPVKWIAFNAVAYVYGSISSDFSYIQWKLEVLFFFKYLKIAK